MRDEGTAKLLADRPELLKMFEEIDTTAPAELEMLGIPRALTVPIFRFATSTFAKFFHVGGEHGSEGWINAMGQAQGVAYFGAWYFITANPTIRMVGIEAAEQDMTALSCEHPVAIMNQEDVAETIIRRFNIEPAAVDHLLRHPQTAKLLEMASMAAAHILNTASKAADPQPKRHCPCHECSASFHLLEPERRRVAAGVLLGWMLMQECMSRIGYALALEKHANPEGEPSAAWECQVCTAVTKLAQAQTTPPESLRCATCGAEGGANFRRVPETLAQYQQEQQRP